MIDQCVVITNHDVRCLRPLGRAQCDLQNAVPRLKRVLYLASLLLSMVRVMSPGHYFQGTLRALYRALTLRSSMGSRGRFDLVTSDFPATSPRRRHTKHERMEHINNDPPGG